LAFVFSPNLIRGIDRAPFGKIAGQGTPLATGTQCVQNGTEDLVESDLPGLGFFTSSFKQGLNLGKLFAADVAGVLGSHGTLRSLRKNESRKHQMKPHYKQKKRS